MPEDTVLIAICTGHTQAEKAIAELWRLGLNMTNLSVFGKAYLSDEYVVGCYIADGRSKALGGSVAFWDRLWKLARRGRALPRPRDWAGRGRRLVCPHTRCHD